MALAGLVIPGWARWAVLALAFAFTWTLGDMHGHTKEGEKHTAYVLAEAAASTKIVEAQVKVVTKVETVYRDRIQKIYVQGEKIATLIPNYVLPADDARYGVSTGFVRVVDAAWSGAAPGPADDSDREPAGVPLSAIAEVEAHNATSCLAWRAQALGLRTFYAGQQEAVNGEKPAWYTPE